MNFLNYAWMAAKKRGRLWYLRQKTCKRNISNTGFSSVSTLSLVAKIPFMCSYQRRLKNILQPSVWNKRARYCWVAKQMIALCWSPARWLLPNVDGIIGFQPPRHLHQVVYQPKGLLQGRTAMGGKHILQLIQLAQTIEMFKDRKETNCLRKISKALFLQW